MQIRCISFNIAGAGDMMHLLLKHPLSITDQRIAAAASHILSNPHQPDIEALNEFEMYAKTCYRERATQTFLNIIRNFDPHILCLQEITSGEEHAGIVTLLNESGYNILRENGLAIAYKSANFHCLDSQRTASDETAALFIDLKIKGTNKSVRVVSDHLAGFNTLHHKNYKTLCKTSRDDADKQTASDKRKRAPKLGDNALKQNIAVVDQLKKRMWLPCCFGRQDMPDALIYGLDANATARYVSKQHRVHPKRLDLFTKHGFCTDSNDVNPTITDHSTSLPYKYDYLFCKSVYSVTGHEIAGINTQDMLGNPNFSMSDHLPVLATITL